MPWAEALITSEAAGQTITEDGRILTYVDALREALTLALDLDPKVFVLGQGVNDSPGMFGMTTDLHKKFSKDRVFDTPLSEEGITGICTGAALNGTRPVYLHNRLRRLPHRLNRNAAIATDVHFLESEARRITRHQRTGDSDNRRSKSWCPGLLDRHSPYSNARVSLDIRHSSLRLAQQ